jgi:hypothetical protein
MIKEPGGMGYHSPKFECHHKHYFSSGLLEVVWEFFIYKKPTLILIEKELALGDIFSTAEKAPTLSAEYVDRSVRTGRSRFLITYPSFYILRGSCQGLAG